MTLSPGALYDFRLSLPLVLITLLIAPVFLLPIILQVVRMIKICFMSQTPIEQPGKITARRILSAKPERLILLFALWVANNVWQRLTQVR